jgi:hypothetical protein
MFTGAWLLRSSNVMEEIDKQYTRLASLALGNNSPHDKFIKK